MSKVGAVHRTRRYGALSGYKHGSGSAAVPCPSCGNAVSKVADSRTVPDGTFRRRRCCSACLFRYTTYESVTPILITDFQI